MRLWLLLVLVLLAGIGLYKSINTLPVPEGYSQPSKLDASGNISITNLPSSPPYSSAPIDSVDDYEYNMVFNNEGGRGVTKEMRDRLMSQYPMDWSTQPPSSDQFEQGAAKYKAHAASEEMPKKNTYYSIDGSDMTPPDSLAAESQERQILMTYVPKNPQSLTTYDAADAKEIINKIYSAKGVIPQVQQNGSIFTIMSTTPVDASGAPIEEPAAAGPATEDARENTIIVPVMQSADITNGTDPFFTPGEVTRDRKWDYTRWTPGLERMFAPTEPMTKWY